jgi:hypothetical protein
MVARYFLVKVFFLLQLTLQLLVLLGFVAGGSAHHFFPHFCQGSLTL